MDIPESLASAGADLRPQTSAWPQTHSAGEAVKGVICEMLCVLTDIFMYLVKKNKKTPASR